MQVKAFVANVAHKAPTPEDLRLPLILVRLGKLLAGAEVALLGQLSKACAFLLRFPSLTGRVLLVSFWYFWGYGALPPGSRFGASEQKDP
jgi:hypothetical protein